MGKRQPGLLPNPQLVMDTESPVERNGATTLTSRVTFTLPTGGKRRWRMAAAEAAVARSQAAQARETELILAEAADAAIEVLYLQELAVLQGELSHLAARWKTSTRIVCRERAAAAFRGWVAGA